MDVDSSDSDVDTVEEAEWMAYDGLIRLLVEVYCVPIELGSRGRKISRNSESMMVCKGVPRSFPFDQPLRCRFQTSLIEQVLNQPLGYGAGNAPSAWYRPEVLHFLPEYCVDYRRQTWQPWTYQAIEANWRFGHRRAHGFRPEILRGGAGSFPMAMVRVRIQLRLVALHCEHPVFFDFFDEILDRRRCGGRRRHHRRAAAATATAAAVAPVADGPLRQSGRRRWWYDLLQKMKRLGQ